MIRSGRIRFDQKLSAIANRETVTVLEIRGPRETIQSFLSAEPHVREVSLLPADGDTTRFTVTGQDGIDLREPLAKRIVEKGWGLRRVDVYRETLEDTFMKVMVRGA
jgi:ABC-2 type transport system ATP-binding protein